MVAGSAAADVIYLFDVMTGEELFKSSNGYGGLGVAGLPIAIDGDFALAKGVDALAGQGFSAVYVFSAARDPILAGDFNEDGSVDGDDLADWQNGFGANGNATHAQGDADGDLDVDGADFLAWQREVGSPTELAAGSAAPEPSTLLLLLTVAAAAFVRSGRPAIYFQSSQSTDRSTRAQTPDPPALSRAPPPRSSSAAPL